MSEKLRVGIAGHGVVGKRRNFFIDQHLHLKTVAVCDRIYTSKGTFNDGIRFYPSYRDLLQNEELDILFVCLTNDIAAEVTIAGLKKGYHVFCEKPPGRNLAEIAKVISVEKERPDLKLKYGFNHRYHDSVKDALRIVRNKELGALINLRGVYGKSQIINFQSDWRTKRAIAGGGILLDQGIHMVDLMRLFAGEFQEIHSFVSNSYWKHDVEDNAYALLRTADGVVAMLHSSATQWRHRFHLELSLTEGSIILSGILSGTKSYGEERITVVKKGPNDQGCPRETTTLYNEDNSWRDEIADLADAILNNKRIIEGSAREAMETMHTVYRIYCADPDWKNRFRLDDTVPTI